jgi:hypothetical protein
MAGSAGHGKNHWPAGIWVNRKLLNFHLEKIDDIIHASQTVASSADSVRNASAFSSLRIVQEKLFLFRPKDKRARREAKKMSER